jgi:RNA polymerase sigma factor (sigma-70 family)
MFHHSREFTAIDQEDRGPRAMRRHPEAELREIDRIVRLAASGDPSAWSSLVERFAAVIRAVARAHRLSGHEIEDVMQSTWLQLVQHIDRIREPCAIEAWLRTTAKRQSLQARRSSDAARQAPEPEEGHVEAAPEPWERLAAQERNAALAQALAALPRRQRALLLMLTQEPPPSYADVSLTLGMPIGSIGPVRARILDRLRLDPRVSGLATTDL